MNRTIPLAAAAAVALAAGAAQADTLATYSFPYSASGGFTVDDLPYAPSDVDPGVDAGDLTNGGGLLSPGNPKPGLRLREIFNAGTDVEDADYAAALAANDFLEFSVAPDAGTVALDVDDVFVNFFGREMFTFGVGLYSSADGFATLLDSETIQGMGGNAPPQSAFTQLELDADLTALVAPTTFRLAFLYASPSGAPNDFYSFTLSDANGNPAILVDGEAIIPEPASLGLVGLGGLAMLRRRR